MMRPLRDEVHDYVHAIEDRTTKLFTRIAEEGSLERSGTVLDTIAWDDVLSMTQAQTELVKLVEMTALHQENQSRIDALIEASKHVKNGSGEPYHLSMNFKLTYLLF